MLHLFYFGLYFLAILGWSQVVKYILIAYAKHNFNLTNLEIVSVCYLIAYYFYL